MKTSKIPKEKPRCPLEDKCNVLRHPMASADTPNILAHLGVRFLYTLIAWFILGMGIKEGSFFVSLNLFVIPILMDCWKFLPCTTIRSRIRNAELLICWTWCLFSVLGMMGIFIITKVGDSYFLGTAKDFIGFQFSGLDLKYIWQGTASITGVTLVDWMCNRTQIEAAIVTQEK